MVINYEKYNLKPMYTIAHVEYSTRRRQRVSVDHKYIYRYFLAWSRGPVAETYSGRTVLLHNHSL